MNGPLIRMVSFCGALILFAPVLKACECLNLGNTYDHYRFAEAVVIVTVSDAHGSSAKVVRAWKGEFKPGDVINFRPPVDTCSFTFARNAAYLVFAREDGGFSPGSICSGNGQIEARKKEIDLLNRWSWWWRTPFSAATNKLRRIGN